MAVPDIIVELVERFHRNRDVLVVGVLKGAFVFMADLIRAIDLPLTVDFAEILSYGEGTEST